MDTLEIEQELIVHGVHVGGVRCTAGTWSLWWAGGGRMVTGTGKSIAEAFLDARGKWLTALEREVRP